MFYKEDTINKKTRYNEIVKEQLSGEDYLSVLLSGVAKNPRAEYDYTHTDCKVVKAGKDGEVRGTEKRLCRCLARYGKTDCSGCLLQGDERFTRQVVGATILDYEVPVSAKNGDKIGEIDLLMDYEGKLYCTEFKPIKNTETILRMVAEIITYTYVLEGEGEKGFYARYDKEGKYQKYQKAIMFVKGSEQWKEWTGENISAKYKACDRLREIIEKERIAVFCLTKIDEDGKRLYQVEKLN